MDSNNKYIDNIDNREYHEIFNYINPTLTKSFQLGNELLNKIPYNQIEELEQINNLEKSNKLNYEDYIELLPKLNLNVGDTGTKFISTTLIKQKNYKDLIELLKQTPPFDSMDMFNLYSYARMICNKPISAKEYQKIQADKNILKRNSEQYELNKAHFKNIKSEITF
jgi:hypothetical protein